MSENKLYTFILMFQGGIYVSQIVEQSPKTALLKWTISLNVDEIEGLGQRRKERIIAEAKEEHPTLIKGMTTVWCSMFLSGKNLAVVNYVETAAN